MVKKKNNRISLVVQEGSLKHAFPGCSVTRNKEESLIWTHILTPTPLSKSYKVKLRYERNKGVKFSVVEPRPLPLAKGKKYLPHVYSTPDQRLCLYYPNGFEWNVEMLYTRTIIPWAVEWLYHYEIWVGTGEWHGGGISHENEVEKKLDSLAEQQNNKIHD